MKLYQYDDIKKLNQALGSFAKNGVPVENVKTLAVGDKLQYFVLADPKETPKVESKTEEVAKKTVKEKKENKEKKVEVKVEGAEKAEEAKKA